MWQEFKEFISKGNVINLAIGVIIGGAFNAIVTALVDNILTPILGIIVGGLDFSNLSFDVGSAKIMYGAFIQAIINFLIVSFCLFLLVKFINMINKQLPIDKKEEKEEEKKPTDQEKELMLLTEIRDALVKDEPKIEDKK